MVSELIYKALRKEQAEHGVKELNGKPLIGVTDLLHCSNRYHLLRNNPNLTFESLKKPVIVRGLLLHRAVQQILKDNGFEIEKQIMLEFDKFILSGRIDAVKDDLLVEIKSTKNIPLEPYPSWLTQLNLYMLMYDEIYKTDSKGVVLVVAENGIAEFELRNKSFVKLKEVEALVERLLQNSNIKIEECKLCYLTNFCDFFPLTANKTTPSSP